MLMLDDTGVRNLPVRIIDHRIALVVVASFDDLLFKMHRAVLQLPEAVMEILINHTGIKYLVKAVRPLTLCFVFLFEILIRNTEAYRRAFQHLFHNGGIAALGNALIRVVEIVVVIHKAEWKSLDDKGGQILAIPAPLLFRVAFNQLFIDVPAH